MNVATGHDVVVVGAGILGLASAYHILQAVRGLDLLVLARLPGAGGGCAPAKKWYHYWQISAPKGGRGHASR